MWQDVSFAGGLHTATQPASSPEGTLAECLNADVTDGSVKRRAGLVLLGTPSGLAASPVVKGVGWGVHAGTQEVVYAVTNNAGGITVYKWSPSDISPIAISPSLNINSTVAISHGAFGQYVYIAVSDGTTSSWYRHKLGAIPPDPEAFKALVGASSVSPPASIAYEFDATLPRYQRFGSTGEGSSLLFTSDGTAPTSVVLGANGSHVKATYAPGAESGSTLEVTVTLAAARQFLIDWNDAMAMLIITRNCSAGFLYIELETQGGATWRGYLSGVPGGYGVTSWVVNPVQAERRDLRDTEKVVKVRFKLMILRASAGLNAEIWVDSPLIGGTYLWNDPWLTPAEQPMKYAAQYIDNNGNRSTIGAVTEVSEPADGTWAKIIGTHLRLTPAASDDPLMTTGQIVVMRALRTGTEREEKWYELGTITNNFAAPVSITDKRLPREHKSAAPVGTTSLPVSGVVHAIIPHKERLFVAIENQIWVSAMGDPERFVVDAGFDPLAPTAPERHFASSDQSARVVAFASGDALLVCTNKGAYIEFGWPDQLAYQRVKVFDDPCEDAASAMGASVFTSTMGLFATGQSGDLQEISSQIRGSYMGYKVAVHRGTVYMVNGTNVRYMARTGAWHAATLPVSMHTVVGAFSDRDYPIFIGNDGKVYSLDSTSTTDNGTAITWRVVTNMVRVPDGVPVEVRYSAEGSEPAIKLRVPGRGEVPVATFGQAGFTSQDFNGLGLQVVVEGSADTVLRLLQVRWEPDGDRPMQLNE